MNFIIWKIFETSLLSKSPDELRVFLIEADFGILTYDKGKLSLHVVQI